MSVHGPHEALPGYSEAQIYHDGCRECEARAKLDNCGISALDQRRFVHAWRRAAEWNRHGLPDLSRAECRLLSTLWSVQVKLENRGIEIGHVPGIAL